MPLRFSICVSFHTADIVSWEEIGNEKVLSFSQSKRSLNASSLQTLAFSNGEPCGEIEKDKKKTNCTISCHTIPNGLNSVTAVIWQQSPAGISEFYSFCKYCTTGCQLAFESTKLGSNRYCFLEIICGNSWVRSQIWNKGFQLCVLVISVLVKQILEYM